MSTTSDYTVGVTIGEGSFGRVLHGRHKATGREVAIKVIDKASLHKRPQLLHNLLIERSVLLDLKACGSVVNLWASFHDSECLYFVMECALGGDLKHVIKEGLRRTSTSPKKRAWWLQTVAPHYGLQIVSALECIHFMFHTIHGDLKPENVLVTSRGQLQLADFGSAVVVTGGAAGKENANAVADQRQQAHQRQQVFGTVDYSGPEVLHGMDRENFTTSVDLWSLGCIFHALLMGESPFHAQSDALAVETIVEYVKDPSNYSLGSASDDPKLLTGWRSLIESLLRPDPGERLGAGDLLLWQKGQNHMNKMISSNNVNDCVSSCCKLSHHRQQHDLMYSSIRSSCVWEHVELNKEPCFLPPKPDWWMEAKVAKMRDGRFGWSSFVL